MRIVIVLLAASFVGGLAAACAFFAGMSQGGPIAFALGAFTLAIAIPLALNQLSNWGVPGDEPPPRWRRN